MKNSQFKTKIVNAIKEIDKHDLAYLLLTSKSERTFRDKVACYFHKRDRKDFFIAREHYIKKSHKTFYDLAIFKRTKKSKKRKIPIIVAEFKVSAIPTHMNHFIEDLKNFKKRGYREPKKFIIMLTGIQDKLFEDAYEGIVKWHKERNSLLSDNQNKVGQERAIENAKKSFEKMIGDSSISKKKIQSEEIEQCKYYDKNIIALLWVVGPI